MDKSLVMMMWTRNNSKCCCVSSSPPACTKNKTTTDGNIRVSSRILVGVAALLLSVTYFKPLWRITLDAPQYPEGLGMEIWINQVKGQTEGDLQKINNLNHYIGMKKINQESIPELRIMPWIMRSLLLMGLVVSFIGKRRLLLVWTIVFILIALAGLADFYRWGYDYGHNLDLEHAIIKVPGMSYQPPLIGSKYLLNFKATSLPGLGGFILIGVILLSAIILLFEKYKVSLWKRVNCKLVTTVVFLLLMQVGLNSCQAIHPEAINYGSDLCDYCKMTIADSRFGAELITTKGKVYRFDSIECLAAFELVKAAPGTEVHSLWVIDFYFMGSFLKVTDAVFVLSEAQRSPMGVGLIALSSKQTAQELIRKSGGTLLNWEESKKHVKSLWKVPGQ